MAARVQAALRSRPSTLRSTRPLALASISAAPFTLATLLCAAGVGVALAISLPLGLALVAAVCFVTVAIVNLPVGVALWLPLMFFQAVPALNVAGKAAGLSLVLVWLCTLRGRNERSTWAVVRHRRLLVVMVLLFAWLAFSLLWAPVPDAVLDDLWRWYALGLLFVLVLSSVSTRAAIRLMLSACVAGSVISLAVGILKTGFSIQAGARLEGTQGDPNFLAASLVASCVLAAALMAQTRNTLVRSLLMLSVAWLLVGVAATASRGGIVALAIAFVAAFAFLRPQRPHVVGLAAVTTTVLMVFFLASPGTWQRITQHNAGSGRIDIWTVAWRVAQEHPVAGVGLNNFRQVEADYVREPGELSRVDLIVDPHFIHNLYLEVLTETGVVGLSLFLLFVGWCLRAGWLAGHRFEDRGQPAAAILARAVLVACVALLGASFFLSSATDLRLWFLLAMGPASLLVAELQRGTSSPTIPTRPIHR